MYDILDRKDKLLKRIAALKSRENTDIYHNKKSEKLTSGAIKE